MTNQHNLPDKDDAPWLNHAGLSQKEIEDLRKQKFEISQYAKQKFKELMNNKYEFNENLAIIDETTHRAIISHFNKIEEINKNKKFEWEDEPIPEENYCITFDFDEWLDDTLFLMENIYECFHYEKPENLKEDTIGYVNQIKDYIGGFLLGPTALYNRKSIEAKTYKVSGENFDEIVNFVKELKENNEIVFLYEISKYSLRAQGVVVETGQTFKCFYTFRYGVLND